MLKYDLLWFYHPLPCWSVSPILPSCALNRSARPSPPKSVLGLCSTDSATSFLRSVMDSCVRLRTLLEEKKLRIHICHVLTVLSGWWYMQFTRGKRNSDMFLWLNWCHASPRLLPGVVRSCHAIYSDERCVTEATLPVKKTTNGLTSLKMTNFNNISSGHIIERDLFVPSGRAPWSVKWPAITF